MEQDHLWPFMILGPLSTLANWMAEFERWCPAIPTVMYHGSKKDRAAIRSKRLKLGTVPGTKLVYMKGVQNVQQVFQPMWAAGRNNLPGKEFPVVITSYEIVLADIKFMQKFKWKYIIVDEGHRLKNWNCKLLRELRTLESANKLILSGGTAS